LVGVEMKNVDGAPALMAPLLEIGLVENVCTGDLLVM